MYVDAAIAPTRNTGHVKLHGPAAFEGMRRAGRLAAECLDMILPFVAPGAPGAAPVQGPPAAEALGLNFLAGFDLREVVREYEVWLIEQTIQRAGSKRKAAELLGVDIATIVRKSRSTAS